MVADGRVGGDDAWPAPVSATRPPGAAGPWGPPERPTRARRTPPPLLRVALPPSTVVRLPSAAPIRVTPLVARSARVLTDDELDAVDGDLAPWSAWSDDDRRDPVDDDRPPTDAPADDDHESGDDPADDHPADDPASTADDPMRTPTDTPERRLGGERLAPATYQLRDRLAPSSRTTIDRVLITASGVWLVSLEQGGRVELGSGTRRNGERRLVVGGRDRTDRAVTIGLAAHQVRRIVARHDVPVHAAVCVVGAERSLLSGSQRIQGVWICVPRQLIELAQRPGPLDREETRIVAELLGTRLRTSR